MFFYILKTLFTLVSSAFVFDDITIELQPQGSSPIVKYTSSPDTCGRIVARTNQIYHISTENLFQSIPKRILSMNTNLLNVSEPSLQVSTFDVSQAEFKMVLLTTAGTYNIDKYITNQTTMTASLQNHFAFLPRPSSISISSDRIWTLTVDNINSKTVLKVINESTGWVLNLVNIQMNYTKMEVNQNYTKCVVWTQSGEITIFEANTLTNLSYFPKSINFSGNSVVSLAFSPDNELIILETDNISPVKIINISSSTVTHEISINEVIKQIHFIDTNNQILLVFGLNSLILVNLTNNKQYRMPAIYATTFTVDNQGNIFTCINNAIYMNKIAVSETIDEQQFVTSLELTDDQQATVKTINNTLQFATKITSSVSTIAFSFPLSIYFLGFMNYFTMCSLYVLLNFPIPEIIYKYLSFLYIEFNNDLFALFGAQIKVEPLSDEKVTSKRGKFFNISSDFMSSSVVSFIFLIGNIALILFIQFLSSFLRKSNYFRQLFNKQKWQLFYGQIINLMAPFVLPWTFIMLEAGVRNVQTKFSATCNIIIFFMTLVFPIYYLFEMLQQREQLLMKERRKYLKAFKKEEKKIENQNTFKPPPVTDKKSLFTHLKKNSQLEPLNEQKEKKPKQVKFSQQISKTVHCQEKEMIKVESIHTIGSEEKEEDTISIKRNENKLLKKQREKIEQKYAHYKEPITFKDLITAEILEQWFLCQANFLLPCLVLLSNPQYFLIIIFFYLLLGVIIAFKKKSYRFNSILLSLYPFVFHICFMVFYWSTSNNVLVFFQFLCMTTFLAGSAHHTLTIAVEVLTFFSRIIQKFSKKNLEVKPICQKSDEQIGKSEKVDMANSLGKSKRTLELSSASVEKKIRIKKDNSLKKTQNLKIYEKQSKPNV